MALDVYLGNLTGHIGIMFIIIVIPVSMAAGDELRSMWKDRDDCPNMLVVLIGMAAILGFSCAPVFWKEYPPNCPVGKTGWTLFGFGIATGAAFVYEMVRYSGNEHGVIGARLGRTLLIFGYVGLLFSFLSHVRLFGPNQLGMFAFFSTCAIPKFSDAAAYFAGKSLGRNKMTPKLSPGKTVEGTIGGLIGGIGAALFVFYVIAPNVFGVSEPFRWWAVILLGLALSVAGIIGDLAESLLKRESETKDSSSWLPGLGGILDIVDSIMVAVPVAYAFWVSEILIEN